ncbi:hypothetical protein GOHSU_46_00130 [Gordonia hirsuta DSM 44140 = NBRC 16056]|uniref:ABC-2 type transporter transmembrane domain-containing protein n=1 Tax=Gordonia hirsuta DSM 44140 = NBRC 16056 TaxID=1121927 RepID=L7LF35_9ACTN|nr:ABC transporter permease [Gordonia hirsuta]GAC58692.1 hypothetical protein GOHSU_46_00130 [Gordonia hirsuta DSM 44140 = NBRC 16056]
MIEAEETVEGVVTDPAELDPAELDAEAAAAAKRAKAEKIARIAAIFIMPLIMVGMMITGYMAAMTSPEPNNIPIAVTGADAAGFAAVLEADEPDAFDVRTGETSRRATEQVLDRDIAAAISVDGDSAVLYTATAAGSSQASVITRLVTPIVAEQGLTLQTEDLMPLPDSDMAGMGAMFLATALAMAGYLPFSFLVSNSPELLRFRRIVPLLAGWAALIGGLVWLVAGPILGVLAPGHGAAVFGIAWLGVFAIGSVQLLLTRLFGTMAVVVGLLFIMVLGVPASSLGISMYTLPTVYRYFHEFLPVPAIGESMRAVLYFDGNGVWPHIMVLAIGAAIGLALTLVVDAIKRRRHIEPKEIVINMPSLLGGRRPENPVWRYIGLVVFPLLMVAMMFSAMLGAMGTPSPKDMPVAVVGQEAEQTVQQLGAQMGDSFDLRVTDSVEKARELVSSREVAAAFLLPSGQESSATLVTNQAGGSTAQLVVSQVFSQVADGMGVPLAVDDVAPLPKRDSNGIASMYIAMGWILAGFMVVIVGASSAPITRRLRLLLPLTAIYSVFMSLVIWVIAAPITGAVHGHFWPMFGVGIVMIFCIAMFAAFFERLLGMFAIIPIVGILMFLGMPASNGAISIYMVPEAFRALYGVLPMSAAVEAARSTLYFGGDTVGANLLTIALWGLVSLVLVIVIDRIRPPKTIIEEVVILDPIVSREPLAGRRTSAAPRA